MGFGNCFANVGIIASLSVAGATVFVWILGLIARNIFTSVTFVLSSRRHMYLSPDDLCFDFVFPKGEGKEKEYTGFVLLGGKGRSLYRIGEISACPISFSSSLIVSDGERGYRFKKKMGATGEVTVRFRLCCEEPIANFDDVYLLVKENRKKMIAKFGDVFQTDLQELSFRRFRGGKRIVSADQ